MRETIRPSLWRAALAVTRRQWINYVRYPSWFISLIIWPVLFPFAYIFTTRALAGPDNIALGTFAELAGTVDYAGFIAIGTTFWMWFNMMLWGFGGALRTEQMRGTMESNYLAPVPKVFLLLGGFLAEAIMGLFMMGISATTLYLVYGVRSLGSVWHLGLIALISVPSIYGIGTIFASLVLVAKETNAMIFFVRGLMTVFCGVTYPLGMLPGWMQAVSRSLPLTHSISAVRHVVAGGSITGLVPELRFLAVSGVLLLLAGFIVYLAVNRRLLDSGTVGQY